MQKPVYPNLAAEMARFGWDHAHMANILGITEADFAVKFYGKEPFTINEGQKILESIVFGEGHYPCSLGTLFAKNEAR